MRPGKRERIGHRLRSWWGGLEVRLSPAAARAYPAALIAVMAWIANFLHFPSFGYYEDDWYHFPSAFGQPLAARVSATLGQMKEFFQGRPLMVLYEGIFGYLGAAFDGIALPYVLTYILFAGSAVLFYRALRMRFPRLYCSLAALLFVLSPLTTVRQNLLIELLVGPALMCVCGATLLRRRHPVAAYLTASLALLTYESVFLLFPAAPLLEPGMWRRKKWRAWAIHLALCGAILAAYVAVRVAFGEARVSGAAGVGAAALLRNGMAFTAYFVIQSFRCYSYAVQTAWREIPLEAVVYVAGFLVWALGFLFRRAAPAARANPSKRDTARAIAPGLRGLGIGVVWLVLGYLTAFVQMGGNPAFPFAGRDTRFSASAVPGSSLLLAALMYTGVAAARGRWVRMAARAAVMVFFAALFCHSFVVQNDYARSWEYQRNFLSQVVALAPDLQADGLVVVRTVPGQPPGNAPAGRVGSIGWQRFGLLVSLKAMGDWPTSPEIVFWDRDDWPQNLALEAGSRLRWRKPPSGSTASSYAAGRVVVLREAADGAITRENGPVYVGGVNIVQARADGGAADSAWRTIIRRSEILARIVSPEARSVLRSLAP